MADIPEEWKGKTVVGLSYEEFVKQYGEEKAREVFSRYYPIQQTQTASQTQQQTTQKEDLISLANKPNPFTQKPIPTELKTETEKMLPVSTEEIKSKMITQEELEKSLNWQTQMIDGKVYLVPSDNVVKVRIDNNIPLTRENYEKLTSEQGFKGFMTTPEGFYAVFVNPSTDLEKTQFVSQKSVNEFWDAYHKAVQQQQVLDKVNQDLVLKTAVVSNVLFSTKSFDYVASVITGNVERQNQIILQQVQEMQNKDTAGYVFSQMIQSPFSVVGLPITSYGAGALFTKLGTTGAYLGFGLGIPSSAIVGYQVGEAIKEKDYTRLVSIGLGLAESIPFAYLGARAEANYQVQQYLDKVFEKGFLNIKADVLSKNEEFVGSYEFKYIPEETKAVYFRVQDTPFGFKQEVFRAYYDKPEFSLSGSGYFYGSTEGQGSEAMVITKAFYKTPFGSGSINQFEYPVVSTSELTDTGIVKVSGYSLQGATKTKLVQISEEGNIQEFKGLGTIIDYQSGRIMSQTSDIFVRRIIPEEEFKLWGIRLQKPTNIPKPSETEATPSPKIDKYAEWYYEKALENFRAMFGNEGSQSLASETSEVITKSGEVLLLKSEPLETSEQIELPVGAKSEVKITSPSTQASNINDILNQVGNKIISEIASRIAPKPTTTPSVLPVSTQGIVKEQGIKEYVTPKIETPNLMKEIQPENLPIKTEPKVIEPPKPKEYQPIKTEIVNITPQKIEQKLEQVTMQKEAPVEKTPIPPIKTPPIKMPFPNIPIPSISLPSGGEVKINIPRRKVPVEKEEYKPSVTALVFDIKGKPEKVLVRPIPESKPAKQKPIEMPKLPSFDFSIPKQKPKRNINKILKGII
jgi:hypothetical protein